MMKEVNAKKRLENEKKTAARAAEDLLQPTSQDKDLHFKVNFKYQDHKVVKLMKPFMNQIISDMVTHANKLDVTPGSK